MYALQVALSPRGFRLLLPRGGEGWDEGDSVAMMDAFVPVSRPLTLTLSPEGEREQPLDVFLKFISQRAAAAVSYAMKRQRALAKERGAILPLRWGEGRGEGKQAIAIHDLKIWIWFHVDFIFRS